MKKDMKKMNGIHPSLLIRIAGVVCLGLTSSASAPRAVLDNDGVEASFVNPPDSARPWTMWHWMNGNISKEGITKDLEAMKAAGVGGVMLFDVIGSQGGPVAFFSEEWRALLRHSVREADRLGLKFSMHNESGWCSSGGSWVKPKDSHKVAVSTETLVKGPGKIRVRLPQPQKNQGYYEDVAVLAFPAAEAGTDEKPEFCSSIPGFVGSALQDNDPATFASLATSVGGQQAYIDISYKKPFTARHITIRPFFLDGKMRYCDRANFGLLVSDDGKDFKPVMTTFRSNRYDFDNYSVGNYPYIAAIPPTTGRVFRLVVKAADPGDFKLAEISLSSAYRLPLLDPLVNMDRWWEGDSKGVPPVDLGPGVIPPSAVIDLSSSMDAEGLLTWEAPPGSWVVLRTGATSMGDVNSCSRGVGYGLEVDKLSSASVDNFWDGMLKTVFNDNREFLGKAFAGIEIDSYEQRSANWTARMPQEFKRLRGYDLQPYLPVLAGHVVGSQELSTRFLWDFRRTCSDLFVKNYSGHMRELANRDGVSLFIESYHAPCDVYEYGSTADFPMGEFWLSDSIPGANCYRAHATCRLAATTSHVYGKAITGAEAFTASEYEASWTDHPFTYKALGDFIFTLGVNQMVFHRFTHQPREDLKPGLVMHHWGSHFDRNNTWWPFASGYMRYLARCQFLLQQGRFAGDIAYYVGEDVPCREGKVDVGNLEPKPPKGYDYVSFSRAALLDVAKAEGDALVMSGVPYRVLVLLPNDRMTLPVLEKIASLVKAGVTVYGQRPSSSPSLEGYPQCDGRVRELADALWGDCDGKTVKQHRYGKGRVVCGLPLPEVMQRSQDFGYTSDSEQAEINFIHRTLPEADVYFIANRKHVAVTASCTFRIKGRQPELWDPNTGHTEQAPVFTATDEGVRLPLSLEPAGSLFVVFRRPLAQAGLTAVDFRPLQPEAPRKALRDRLTVTKAVFVWSRDGGREMDITESFRSLIDESRIDLGGRLSLAPHRGLFNIPGGGGYGNYRVSYTLDGEPYTAVYDEETFGLAGSMNLGPIIEPVPVKLCEVAKGPGGPVARLATSGTLTVTRPGQPPTTVSVAGPSAPLDITGPWSLAFGERGPQQPLTLTNLISWSKHTDPLVRYYSGTGRYTATINLPPQLFANDGRLLLDLGVVREITALTINGRDAGILWKPPFRMDATELLKPGANTIEVAVANLWVNRLIGDEQFPRDYPVRSETYLEASDWPTWAKEGKPRTEPRRLAFSTFQIQRADSQLLPSGLLGPVQIIPVKTVTLRP